MCFDLDGTILDSYGEGLNRLLEIARSRNLPTDETIVHAIKNSWHISAHGVISSAWPEADHNMIQTEWSAKDARDPLPLLDRVQETLERLRKFFFLGILTNRSEVSTLRQLERMPSVFDFVYSAKKEFYKPHPSSMEQVFQKCQELEINHGHITYIGDVAETDWQLARNVNVRFVGVLSGAGTRESFIKSGLQEKYILDSIADLPNFYEIDKLVPFR